MAECRERLPQLADAEAGLERAKSRMEAAETFFENMRLLYEVYCQRDRAQSSSDRKARCPLGAMKCRPLSFENRLSLRPNAFCGNCRERLHRRLPGL